MKLILSLLVAAVLSAQAKQPNFILFITDDISWDDLGFYGSKAAKTLNLNHIS